MPDRIVETDLKNGCFGWKSKIGKKRETFTVSIEKHVAIGSGLKKGDQVYAYLKHVGKRPTVLIYLDGEEEY